ncbi:rod-binding protein [Paracoccus sp. (in: a-proteobacteria)]|uniref:rod-binding protein n=1 Tax=Paracoccus sp. TaxID=267 RepID=UPI00396C7D24
MQIESIASAQAPAARQAAVADQLEQAFLEEMLKYCGPGAMQGEFSGGAGEDQFTSFLTREQASQLASRLDLGFGRMLAGQAQ